MAAIPSTGYGPSHARLVFDGNEEKFELWEVKFKAYLRTHKLSRAITEDRVDTPKFIETNALVYAELVQLLDDKSLSLVIREAEDDGRLALDILRDHYCGKSKPRIIAQYTELTSLRKDPAESVTDYFLRAEKNATALKNAGEVISDGLLVAMCLKGLPAEYATFSTVITQREDDVTFVEFKSALKSFEETMKPTPETTSERIMKTDAKQVVCYSCQKPGHKKYECPLLNNKNNGSSSSSGNNNYSNKWCHNCSKNNHNTNECRRKKPNNYSAKNVNDSSNNPQSHGFAMKVSDYDKVNYADVNVKNLLVDCGATSHIITDKDKFITFDKYFDPSSHYIELADGSRSNNLVYGKGDASVVLNDDEGCAHNVLLKNALCIPSYSQDIFSVRSAVDQGVSVAFTPESSDLVTENGTRFNVQKSNNLYYLYNVNHAKKKTRSLQDWHEVLGHCNIKDVLNLENAVEGMTISSKSNFNCESCIKGKMCEYRNRSPDLKAKNVLDLVHCDLAGPIDPEARDGFRYAAVFVDDYSGAVFVYLLRKKSDTIVAAKKFLSDVAPQGNVKCIRSDNGTEFTNNEFQNLMLNNNIKHEFSAPYSAFQNGTAERSWRSIFEMTRCLLIDAELPKSLWGYAVKASAYIRNRCYNNRTKGTAYESFTKNKPNISNMHTFGSKCFSLVQDKKKLDPRSVEGIFVGYDHDSPAYLVYYPDKNIVRRVRCVKFVTESNKSNDIISDVPNVELIDTTDPVNDVANDISDNIKRNPVRTRNKPHYLSDFVTEDDKEMSKIAKCSVDYCYRVANIPKDYNEAIDSPQSGRWKSAMIDEMNALKENDTFTKTILPEGKSTISSKWVYSVKTGINNEDKFKARLVARGFNQREGLDYTETFSPTAKIVSIRMLLQLAVNNDFSIHQMDVKSAYLNAKLDEELYLDVPDGFNNDKPMSDNVVWKLNKSLYGLKQSGRNWNIVFHSFISNLEFNQSMSDPCVYSKYVDNSLTVIIVFVDDVLIASDDLQSINDVKTALSNEFKMKDLGCMSYFLGIDFSFENDSINMNQARCIDKVLDRFNMTECKPKIIPCDPSIVKLSANDSQEMSDCKLYQEIVGSLIYLMSCSRPDITYIVSKLSQFMSNPTKAHFNAAKDVLRYLKGTKDYFLKFTKSTNNIKITGFCDSDWAGSFDRKSISGYAFHLSDDGPLISYKSKKQNVVALSSCEAEYIAMTVAIQEAKFLSQLLADMSCSNKQSVLLFVDNQGAINLAKNPIHHQRSKHIDVKYHFIRSEIMNKFIEVKYVPTNENVADVFTKPVTGVKMKQFKCIHGI